MATKIIQDKILKGYIKEITEDSMALYIQDCNNSSKSIYVSCVYDRQQILLFDFYSWIKMIVKFNKYKQITKKNQPSYYLDIINENIELINLLHTVKASSNRDYTALINAINDSLPQLLSLYCMYVEELYLIQQESLQRYEPVSPQQSPKLFIPFSFGLNRLSSMLLNITDVELKENCYKEQYSLSALSDGVGRYKFPNCKNVVSYNYNKLPREYHFTQNKTVKAYTIPESWNYLLGREKEKQYSSRIYILAQVYSQYICNGRNFNTVIDDNIASLMGDKEIFLINYPFVNEYFIKPIEVKPQLISIEKVV